MTTELYYEFFFLPVNAGHIRFLYIDGLIENKTDRNIGFK